MSMRSRRFTALAVVLVALNVFLWLVPQGLALRAALVNQLFGPRLIRAEVVVQNPAGATPLDYRIDRGTIASATGSAITLLEADGTTQPIPVSTDTRILGPGSRRGLAVLARRSARVLVIRQANGPAISIEVEALGAPVKAGATGAGASHRRIKP